jgi:hypothetical protein
VTAGPARSWELALLRAEIDAVLAEWAWHLDHGDYAAVAALFTEDALFVTGAVELRGRAEIENRYTERTSARSTRHTYSGLRLGPAEGDAWAGSVSRSRSVDSTRSPADADAGGVTGSGGDPGGSTTGGGTGSGGGAGRPARLRARSTWVNYAVNGPVPADDVGVYLVADFDDELTWCDDQCWRISERRIIPVFRDPARAPVTG